MDWWKTLDDGIACLEENLDRPVDYEAVARRMGCSLWEFQRIFAFLVHATPAEYVRGRRLTLAAQALRARVGTVTDVALRYGYDSPAAFSRAFRQWHGVSPSAVRNGDGDIHAVARVSSTIIWKEWHRKMNKFSQRGYVVKENGPIYFTDDMDRTIRWFEDVLGWYGSVDSRDEGGRGLYGCVHDVPHEIAMTHISPFNGFHFFRGQPRPTLLAFLQVQGIDALAAYVRANGWQRITSVQGEPWGAKTCTVTTPDGYELRFFETV